MNIIEAYKKAKFGQRIKSARYMFVKLTSLTRVLYARTEEELCADDWEVVREKKTKTINLISNQGFLAATESICIPRGIPPNTSLKVTFEWEE
jgi:hypothetical protein